MVISLFVLFVTHKINMIMSSQPPLLYGYGPLLFLEIWLTYTMKISLLFSYITVTYEITTEFLYTIYTLYSLPSGLVRSVRRAFAYKLI